MDDRSKSPGASVSEADLEAIRQAALDYIEGWYEGDAARMERCLHPDLAKRTIVFDPARNSDRLDGISALGLVLATRRAVGSRVPPAQRRKDVTLLNVFGGIASVQVDSAEYVDYLHLGKLNGQWLIINVLWAWRTPRTPAPASRQE